MKLFYYILKQSLFHSSFLIICYCTLFIFLSPIPSYPQGKIIEVYPNLPRVDYYGVHFFNPDTGFAVGTKGTIIKTNDGGNSWKQILTPINSDLLKIQAFSLDNIFVCGLNGTLLHSTDLGETWDIVDIGTTSHLFNIKIIDQQIGWICGFDSSLYKTENGGISWIKKTTGFDGDYRDIDFYNSQIGYICCTTGFLVTEDSGKTWVSKQMSWLNTVEPLTENIILAGNISGDIFYSTDRGTTWSKKNTTYASNIQSIEMVNDTLGYASALYTGGYYFTTDAGKSWDFEAEKIGNSQITFINDSIGYGVGSNLTFTKTIDKGRTWKHLIINEGINSIYFKNENEGFLCADMIYSFGDFNKLYYTNDGGIRWTKIDNFKNYLNSLIHSITFIDSTIGFMGTDGGFIYKTTDGGNNWSLNDTVLVEISIEWAPLI